MLKNHKNLIFIIKSACRSIGIWAGLALLLIAGACAPRADNNPAGQKSTLPRVASVAPSLTEMVCAVGGAQYLVGRTDVCNYPPEIVSRVPIIGRFGRPFIETMVAQHPTDIIDVDLEDETVIATYKRLGIAHHRIQCRTLDDIAPAVRQVGALVRCAEQSNKMAAEIESRIAALRATALQKDAANRAPRVFVAVWWDPLMTVGKNAFIAEVVTLAGGQNIGDELSLDYATISPEWALSRDPDVIISLTPGDRGNTLKKLESQVGWRDLRAVKERRVLDGFDLDLFSRPGPRILAAIDTLQQALADIIKVAP